MAHLREGEPSGFLGTRSRPASLLGAMDVGFWHQADYWLT